MKHFLIFLFLVPVLTACPGKADKSDDMVKSFREAGYNMTDTEQKGYKNITFQLPKSFDFDYLPSYTVKQNAMGRRNDRLGIVFSVERFTEEDLEHEMMDEIIVEKNLLQSFHRAYIIRRTKSLYNASNTLSKDVKKNVRFPGITQVVSGETSDGYNMLYYNVATLKVDKEYYIFQFIADKDMMDYVYDDFERLLASVRRKK